MSIISSNIKKMTIKVDNEKIIKRTLFLNNQLEYTNQIDVFGVYFFQFANKNHFKKFRDDYQEEINHIKFVEKYKSGKFDHLFDKNK